MQISEHSVRERAYYIWEDEGRVHGRAASHWLRAEGELHALAALVAAPVAAQAPAKVATKAKAAAKPVVAKPAAKVAVKPAAKVAVKPVAPKVAKASKAAVTAGLAAKTKTPRATVAMH